MHGEEHRPTSSGTYPTPPQSDTSERSPSPSLTLVSPCHIESHGLHRWWNTNLPPQEWTEKCPVFLLGQCEKNISIMATLDTEYKKTSWQIAKAIIASGQINLFGRTPSELRRYEKYCHELREQYGSILFFMQHQRLNWPSTQASGDAPFSNPDDYKILFNDWPYALEDGIKHLVIWTKFPIGREDESGHLTPESAQELEEFVVRTFCSSDGGSGDRPSGVSRENLVWFKNWKSLRSVQALEHFHVLLYKPSPAFLDFITHGDIPMSEKLCSLNPF